MSASTELPAGSQTGQAVQILIPVFNDWESVALLLPRIDEALGPSGCRVDILIVDDGSTQDAPDDLVVDVGFKWIQTVRILALCRNMGHQRAIAVGLCKLQTDFSPESVVVMDSDGEDAPEDVPRLIERVRSEGGRTSIFARRKKRAEGFAFRLFYQLYRAFHYAMVGRGVQIGNFSAIPARQLIRLVAVAELWNHYAAATFKSRMPIATIDTERRTRLAGRSKMNFVSLVTHGLSAISVFGETVGTRLLVLSGAVAAFAVVGIASVVGVRLFTDWAVPGWATYSIAFLVLMLLQALTAGFLFTFVLLSNRSQLGTAPLRHYEDYVFGIRDIAILTNERSGA